MAKTLGRRVANRLKRGCGMPRISPSRLLGPLAILATAVWAGPNTQLPWGDDFELYPDQTPLVDGTNGWYADSLEVKVQTNFVDTGLQAAAIPMDATLTNRFTGILITNVWMRLRVRPVLARSEYPALVDTNASSIVFITSNGWFGTWGGSTTNWNTHSNTLAGAPCPPVAATNWITIHLGQNYVTKTWSLFGNNLFLADQVPFVNPNATGFEGFDMYTGIHTTFADNVSVTTNFPADLAADGGDWLPDLTVLPGVSLRTDVYQGDPAVTNYTIWKTNGYLALAYSHELPAEWTAKNWAALTPDPGVTTGQYNTVRISYNTTNMPARVAPYFATITVNGTDSRFGQPARQSPQHVNVEVHVSLRTTTNLLASRGTFDDRIRVEWSPVIGAGQYDVYRSPTNDPASAVHQITLSGTIYDDLDVTANTPYYYWVKTRNPYTTSAFSISNWGFSGMVTPTGVAATDGDYDDRIRITWNTSGAFATYQVWRHTSNHQPSGVQIGTTTALLYDDATAVPGVRYYYWIRATNALGVTAFSLPDTGFLAINPPTSLSASDGTLTDRVHVAWSAAPGAQGYEVWRGPSESTGSAIRVATTTSLNYEDTTVPPGVPFFYRIRSTNAFTRSALSAPDSGFRGVPVPTGVTASDSTYTDKVLVTWDVAEGAASYEIWSGLSASPAASEKIGEAPGLSFADTACDVDTTYHYWVRARVGGILSQFSVSDTGSRRSTAPPSAPPAWVDASDGAYIHRIHIRWPDTAETAEYEVWRNTVNASSSATLICTTAARSCDDTNVIAGMTYYYWLRGRNLSGVSAFSLPDSGYAAPAAPTGQADLELTDLIFLPNVIACGNHPGAISMRVNNHGPDPLRAPDTRVTVDFFIMTNLPFSAIEARWIGDYSADLTLDAEATTRLVLPRNDVEMLTMPTDLTGWFHVYARIRHSYPSGLADPDPSNNTDVRAAPIEIPTQGGGIYQVRNDFDYDGASDLALFHQASGAWYILGANGRVLTWNQLWGGPGFTPISGDFNGDRFSDLVVYRDGIWYVADIQGQAIAFGVAWGSAGFTPVSGDYDGDGVADLAVYHEGSGTWYIMSLVHGLIAFGESWGGPGLAAAPGDFAGTGRTDLSVYGNGGYWYIQSLPNRGTVAWQKNWGYFNMIPVPGDYDGDGYADLAVYGNGLWYIRSLSGDLIAWADSWGGNGYLPVAGDFNGDGKADLAVYHAISGAWFIKTPGQDIIAWGLVWGGPGYAPLGAANY
jgi:hypothetical protein